MANYKLYGKEYRGDSVIDTVPNPTNKAGYLRRDTDTRILYQSDGALWQIVGPVTDTLKEKQGRVESLSRWELDASGWLRDMQYLGTLAGGLVDGSGSSQQFSTGTAGADSWAGHYLIMPSGSFNGWTRPSYLPHVASRQTIPIRTSGDYRFIYGFWTGQALPAAADGNPMDVNNGGVLIGFDSDDAHYQVYVGSGDGSTAPTAPINTGVVVPAGLGNRIFNIFFPTPTTCKVMIIEGNNLTLLYSLEINTNLPAITKSMNFLNLINNPTNANKAVAIYGVWGKAIK